MSEPFDVARCQALLPAAASGDAAARRELTAILWPAWLEMVRSSRSMGSLARDPDHVRNVVMMLVEKLQRGEGLVLRQYELWLERHEGKTFVDWIRIVTTNAVRSYVSGVLGTRTSDGDGPSAKRVLNEFASSTLLEELHVRPPFTLLELARELIEFAERRLPPDQLRVLREWLEGADYERIAATLGITSGDAKRLQHAAVTTIRRYFNPKSE